MASDIALRSSGLSNGGFSRLMIRLVLTLPGGSAQIASARCFCRSWVSGMVNVPAKVSSYLPATKARIAVERFLMIVYSIPSRYGRLGFQYSGFLATLMYSLGLNSTNLNGPVPMGCWRICAGDTWQG